MGESNENIGSDFTQQKKVFFKDFQQNICKTILPMRKKKSPVKQTQYRYCFLWEVHGLNICIMTWKFEGFLPALAALIAPLAVDLLGKMLK